MLIASPAMKGQNIKFVMIHAGDQTYALLIFYCNKNAIIAITAIIANNH